MPKYDLRFSQKNFIKITNDVKLANRRSRFDGTLSITGKNQSTVLWQT